MRIIQINGSPVHSYLNNQASQSYPYNPKSHFYNPYQGIQSNQYFYRSQGVQKTRTPVIAQEKHAIERTVYVQFSAFGLEDHFFFCLLAFGLGFSSSSSSSSSSSDAALFVPPDPPSNNAISSSSSSVLRPRSSI